MTSKETPYVVFDLDDTLYKEEDYLLSAYAHIAKTFEPYLGKNIYNEMAEYWTTDQSTFDIILEKYNIPFSIGDLLELYRFHMPILNLPESSKKVLNYCKQENIPCGLLTDGRSVTQRNKLNALEIEKYFQKIVISEEIRSEKPNMENYVCFNKEGKYSNFYYIGDNLKKDFISPNKLGWRTIGLVDNGRNIHKQDWSLSKEHLPHYKIENLTQVIYILQTEAKRAKKENQI